MSPSSTASASTNTNNATNTNNVTGHHNQATINANTTNNTYNNFYNTTLRPLGKEDVAFLLNDPSFTSFIQNCIQKGVEGVLDFMERKHFDHPENTNVRKMNERDPHMEFFNGGQWVQ
jgi:hypothetical protein